MYQHESYPRSTKENTVFLDCLHFILMFMNKQRQNAYILHFYCFLQLLKYENPGANGSGWGLFSGTSINYDTILKADSQIVLH